MAIQHEYILNPITALQFYQRNAHTIILLAGEGPYLKAYDVSACRLVSQCLIFHSQAIHGIVVQDLLEDKNSLCVVIWGGSQLILLSKTQIDQLLDTNVNTNIDSAGSVSDWILDVSISPFSKKACAIVTAHNTLIKAELNEKNDNVEFEYLLSPLNSSLYCAHLIWDSPFAILVASGTVFGEIIAWKCCLDNKISYFSKFKGHEGSIFGVDISPTITYSDGRVGRLLASCSDDRTIRVWNLEAGVKNNFPVELPIREDNTGFDQCDLKACSGSVQGQVAMAMGHASRIWRVKFFSNNPKDNDEKRLINLISFGEDATAQQWVLNVISHEHVHSKPKINSSLDSKHDPIKFGLTHYKSFAYHSGKHIWSFALFQFDQCYNLSTGGADGKISLYDINLPQSLHENLNTKLVMDDMFVIDNSTYVLNLYNLQEKLEFSPYLQKGANQLERIKGSSSFRDSFNRYAFVSDFEFLVTTTSGRVIRGSIGNLVSWTELYLPQSISLDLRSYTIIEGFPKTGVAYIAGTSGKIYAYSHNKNIEKVADVEGKVADMFKILDEMNQFYALLVTTLHCRLATIFYIDRLSYSFLETFKVTLPEKFVVTSVGVVNDFLIFGSRLGLLAIYKPRQLQMPLDICEIMRENGGDAITAITPLKTIKQENGAQYFVSTCRNGTYTIFSIVSFATKNSTTIQIQLVHRGAPPLGPMIENAWFNGQDLLLYGFKGKCFIVWNETKQCEILKVDCGGAHRSFAYLSLEEEKGGYFIYTKASKLYLFRHKCSSHQTLKQGAHGREIKTCAVSQDHKLIATGAEDTVIRIFKYEVSNDEDKRSDCLAVVKKHTTGIQKLRWAGSQYLLSSGGNGEFFVWATNYIPNFGIGLVCEACCPHKNEERDLRIISFDVTTLSDSYPNTKLLISLGYSDSTLTTYFYSRKSGFTLVASGKYTSSCITQIRHILNSQSQLSIITAATDGALATWNADIFGIENSTYIPGEFKLLSVNKLHQNTVKSLEIYSTKERIIVLTGGDDNALAISVYDTYKLERKPSSSFVLNSAHAAAITGLAICHDYIPEFCLSKRDREIEKGKFHQRLRIVTSSTDQRIKIWILDVLLSNNTITSATSPTSLACHIINDKQQNMKDNITIKLENDLFTSVADVSDVIAFLAKKEADLSAHKILVVGIGMEVWNITNP
ncbi:Regulator of Ty1 transposition protein 10 [Erysiphe neolycopersici]|uniref:Regulator of Ty1 transposition protein 10 n=1 Tax=Erysiphe neolycopersici TaxID=212602 RepID=A0A420I0A1_9PEZI|nr:Regulator of Ty1 transposition protein 10 [Erysiphe neolycopersici]